MPLYEYCCRDCGHRFEVLQAAGKNPRGLRCPQCDAPRPQRQWSSFACASGGENRGGGCAGGSGFT